jgi:beta-galactosidase/beta-glucuronidase
LTIGSTIWFLGTCFALGSSAAAATWAPAKVPLMTRWGKALSPDSVLPEYPRPQMVRGDWQNLNGLWDYAVARKDEPQPKTFQGKILVPFCIESALSGVHKGFDPYSRLWYRRKFDVPAAWAGRRLLLHFGAVDWEAIVWLNGTRVAEHRGGYDAFTCDVTDALAPAGPQELVVAVLDATGGIQPKGKQANSNLEAVGTLAYTAASGIWQTVWIEPVAKASVERLSITPDVDRGEARLAVTGRGTTDGDTIEAVASAGGREVARVTGRLGGTLVLPIPHARLWSPDDPFLYDLRVTLRHAGQTVDAVGSYFGMRKIALGKDAKGCVRMMLNDRPVFQLGPLDQGYWPDGIYTAPADEALRYDIEMTRKLGFNVTRKHVKVEPERWYYWCDKLGLLVWQDMPSTGGQPTPATARQFEAELKAMVEGLANHPAVIMWVIFNEGWGQYDTERLTALVKRLDPSRLVDSVSCIAPPGVGDVIDDHPYWVPATPKADGRRGLVIGEFGGRAMVVHGHLISETRVFGHPGGTVLASRWELTVHYVQLLRHVFAETEKNGLSAAIYTQLTDIEGECNGLLTYDREVVKVDLERVVAANRGQFPPPTRFRVLLPTGRQEPVLWRYTTEQPGADWRRPGFDASAWKEGPTPLGASPRERTRWTTPDVWMRREFEIGGEKLALPQLMGHHATGAEIYINGILAAKWTGYTLEYQEYEIRAEARASLRPGKNLIAVHASHEGKQQLIDVGVVDPLPPTDKSKWRNPPWYCHRSR